MVDEVINALVASGPMALLMGLVVLVLWLKLQSLRAHYEGDPSDPTKPGRIKQDASAAQDREDKLRKHFEDRLDAERAANKEVVDEFREFLKGE
jgi:hypothetical protein